MLYMLVMTYSGQVPSGLLALPANAAGLQSAVWDKWEAGSVA